MAERNALSSSAVVRATPHNPVDALIPGEAVSCPVCGGRTLERFRKRGYPINRCPRCGHRCLGCRVDRDHVSEVYGDDYFYGGGAGYPNYLTEKDTLTARGRWYAHLLGRHMPVGRVLDVGAAAGFVLKGFVETGWEGAGLEPNGRMVSFARSELGLRVEQGTLESASLSEQFDLVSMIQVVAHFVDPRRALERAAALTRPGGHWLIETWNRDSWVARLLGQHWHEYSPPSVLHWFSPAGLARLTRDLGFEEVARGRPSKWIGGAHVRSLLTHAAAEAPLAGLWTLGARAVPERLAIPYPADDIFWALYRRRGSASA